MELELELVLECEVELELELMSELGELAVRVSGAVV